MVPNQKLLAEISTMTASERFAALNWLANQSEEIKSEIMQRHANLLTQNLQPGQQVTGDFSLAYLGLASKQIRINLTALKYKRDLSVTETEEISRKRIEGYKSLPRKRKSSKKLDRFQHEFFPLVCILRDQHSYSWHQIVGFLWQHHQYEISKAYLQTIYKKCLKEVTTHEVKA